VIILPSTPLEGAREVAEKIRHTINELVFDELGHISCSFGVGQFVPSDNFHSLILRVDEAMYKAKANGRNRVEVAN